MGNRRRRVAHRAMQAEEACSSRTQPVPPPPVPQHQDRVPSPPPPPPSTHFKKKVKWSYTCLSSGTRDGTAVRSLGFDEHDTGRVKGDDSEEPFETDAEIDTRVELGAHFSQTQNDLIWASDVVRKQVEDAAETFVVDSVRINDESDGDPTHILNAGPATVADGIGTKDPACGTEKSAPQAGSVAGQEDEQWAPGHFDADDVDFEEAPKRRTIKCKRPPALFDHLGQAVLAQAHQQTAGAEDDDMVTTLTTEVLSERLGFGNMYKNTQLANAAARSTHAPLQLVPAAPHPDHYL